MSFLLQFFNFGRRFLLFRRVGLSLFLVAFAFFSISPLQLAALGQPFAQGNLFIVFHPSSGHSTEQNSQMANLNHSLWCQATENSIDRLQIKEANFVRTLPKPETVLPASRYNRKNDRAYLEFAPFSAAAIGKYRCEITTEDDENVTGNLFVYMRPILVNKVRLDQAEENNSFAWIGQPVKVNEGDDAILTCQAIGYPLPQIQWFKDGEPLNTTALLPNEKEEDGQYAALKYHLIAQSLHVLRVDQNDEGNYKCIATNSFPLHVDEKLHEFQVTFEQKLQLTTKLSWLLPLLIIIFGLIILGFIILGCSRWKQYNVAQNERELGKKGVADGQKLRLDHDDVED